MTPTHWIDTSIPRHRSSTSERTQFENTAIEELAIRCVADRAEAVGTSDSLAAPFCKELIIRHEDRLDMASAAPRIELGHLRDGYPALTARISQDPDSETFVFRRFDRLAARSILHLQAHLTSLEQDLDAFDDEARRSADEKPRQSSRRWETLMTYEPAKNRVEKLEELRLVLEDYCWSRYNLKYKTGADSFR
jgi:hypothetical protein